MTARLYLIALGAFIVLAGLVYAGIIIGLKVARAWGVGG